MKKILIYSLILSLAHSLIGAAQSITITPNNSSLFNAKGTSNQFLLKNDTLKLIETVLSLNVKTKSEILDQQNSEFSINKFLFSGFQTFTAGLTGKLTKVEFNYFNPYSDIGSTLKIYSGDGTLGPLLATKSLPVSNGWNSIILDSPISIINSSVYTLAFDSPNNIIWKISANNYAGGHSSFSPDNDFAFRTYVKTDQGMTVNTQGDVTSNGTFFGNGAGLTNLNAANLSGTFPPSINGFGITNLNAANLSGTFPPSVTTQGNAFNGASQLLQLDASGFLGLGVALPKAQLHLSTSVVNRKIILWQNNDNDNQFYGFGVNGGVLRYQVDDITAAHVFYAGASATTSTELFRINGTGGACLNGNMVSTGASCTSDIRYKKDFSKIENPLDKVLKMRGLQYFWKTEDFKEKNFSKEKQIGFIAQEVEKLFPELVQTDEKGYKSVDYARLTPVLVEAMKEQQKKFEKLEKDFENLKNLVLQAQNGK